MKDAKSRLGSAGIKGTLRAKKQEVGKAVVAFNRGRDEGAINDTQLHCHKGNGQKLFSSPCQSQHP